MVKVKPLKKEENKKLAVAKLFQNNQLKIESRRKSQIFTVKNHKDSVVSNSGQKVPKKLKFLPGIIQNENNKVNLMKQSQRRESKVDNIIKNLFHTKT